MADRAGGEPVFSICDKSSVFRACWRLCVPEDRGLVVFEKQINQLVNCLRILSLTYSMTGSLYDPDSPVLRPETRKAVIR